ncbi:MAG: hypothetical protein VX294_15755 [Candidatus Latescibacterota bacterium]|nr:hypothetical protein [Candidatus Latescibacterota bacterium]
MLTRIFVFIITFGASNYAQEPGRTDGVEESEFGRGGYPFAVAKNSWSFQASLGSGRVNSESKSMLKEEVTDLYYGFKIGYKLDFFDFYIGYSRIEQQNSDFYGFGVTRERPAVGMPDIKLGFSLGSELIKRNELDTEFAIIPGINAGIMLNNHFILGIDYRRSIVFSDYNVTVNRFGAYFKTEF